MINKETINSGDMFLIGSDKTGPKIVKYLMRSPTLWHDLYRMITKTQEKVPYYHVGMFVSNQEIIEQQWKVEVRNSSKIIGTSKNVMIIRYKNVTEDEMKY